MAAKKQFTALPYPGAINSHIASFLTTQDKAAVHLVDMSVLAGERRGADGKVAVDSKEDQEYEQRKHDAKDCTALATNKEIGDLCPLATDDWCADWCDENIYRWIAGFARRLEEGIKANIDKAVERNTISDRDATVMKELTVKITPYNDIQVTFPDKYQEKDLSQYFPHGAPDFQIIRDGSTYYVMTSTNTSKPQAKKAFGGYYDSNLTVRWRSDAYHEQAPSQLERFSIKWGGSETAFETCEWSVPSGYYNVLESNYWLQKAEHIMDSYFLPRHLVLDDPADFDTEKGVEYLDNAEKDLKKSVLRFKNNNTMTLKQLTALYHKYNYPIFRSIMLKRIRVQRRIYNARTFLESV